jgi:AbrB family looped-hinge helix DNA binding protein
MTSPEKPTITLSTKGQMILPKAIRQRRHWDAGTRLVVEDRPDGVMLTAAPLFPPTRPEAVYGSLKHAGPPRTVEEMDATVLARATRNREKNIENSRDIHTK